MRAALILCFALALAACFGDATVGRLPCTAGDKDRDGVCDDVDRCLGADDTDDADGDGVCDAADRCPGADDRADADEDGVCDALDRCPGAEDAGAKDADGDGVCDEADSCAGADDRADLDGDGAPDCVDVCDYDGPAAPELGPLDRASGWTSVVVRELSVESMGRTVSAAAGSAVQVRVELTLRDCACPGCIYQVYLGYHHEAAPRRCIYNAIPGCEGVDATFVDVLPLPAEPGEYGVRLGATRDYQCDDRAWTGMERFTDRLDDLAVICAE